MSSMVLTHVEQAEKLEFLTSAFKQVSTSEVETKTQYENRINKFLDAINEDKEFFRSRSARIEDLLPKIEELSWFSDPEEEILATLQNVINLMRKLHRQMVKNFADSNRTFTRHGVDKTELRRYKSVADDLKELAEDLHACFFVFPQDEEFQATTSKLNSL